MAQTFVCKSCGITFRGKASKKPQHCSRACQKVTGQKNRQRSCEQCGKEFEVSTSAKEGKYCSRGCSMEAQRIRINYICAGCGKHFNEQPSEDRKYCSHKCYLSTLPGKERPIMKGRPAWNTGKTADTDETLAACAKKRTGELSILWKGGKTKYYGPFWYRQARQTRQRDGYKCQHCGISQKKLGRKLDVHHIVPFRNFGYIYGQNTNNLQANELSNLISLCHPCHQKAELGKIPIQPSLL